MNRALTYFIYAPEVNRVKIGVSDFPSRRMFDMQTGSPCRLELIGMIDGGLQLESDLHARFKNCHSHREWFYLEGDLLAFIKTTFSEYYEKYMQVETIEQTA